MEDTTFHLQPWAPRVRLVAERLMEKIHEIAPELEVLFMGAAALGLPGKNDIDLDILCDSKDITHYTQKLIAVLGEPKESKSELTVWEFVLDGFEIDAILSDPKTSHVPEQRAVFERLQADPALLEEYRKLKEHCDGLPYSDYEHRKKAFFNDKVLAGSNE